MSHEFDTHSVQLFPSSIFLLVKRTKAKEQTLSGIYIPPSGKEKPSEGIILRVGKKVEEPYKPGETILFGRYSGTEVSVDEEDFLLLREDEILGILADRAED